MRAVDVKSGVWYWMYWSMSWREVRIVCNAGSVGWIIENRHGHRSHLNAASLLHRVRGKRKPRRW